MQLNDIQITDKKLFKNFSAHTGVTNQFSGFVNLFLWKKAEKIKYFFHNNKLIVTGESPENGQRYFMFPNVSCITKTEILYLKENFGDDWIIFGLSESDSEYLSRECGDILSTEHIRDMDNYIYLSQNLINLSGRKYHSKKNHINSFKRNYNYKYLQYNNEYRDSIMKFLGKWYINNLVEESLLRETAAITSALDNFEELELKGGIITVEDKVVAFTMGEQLTDCMAVIHFEKADTDYAGSYAVINNEFVKNEWSHLTYINREEDMGIEGLRKSKLSYKPDILLKVYRAFPKI